MPGRFLRAVAVAALAAGSLLCAQTKPLQPQSRVWIIRALLAEYAVTKHALPRGTEGIQLKAVTGEVDERSAEVQLANQGPAIRQGEVAQITRLNFKRSSIQVELNGGGKKKRRWFERIEVGMGGSGSTVPIRQDGSEAPGGSYIELVFDGQVPDMTVEQAKEYLAPVLDFNQRSASLISTESWPPEIQEAVKNHTIVAGMTREQVIAAKGKPENKIREKKGRIEQETWVYGSVPSKILLVTFENDEVVEAREYLPGVPATKVPRVGDPPDTSQESLNDPKSKQDPVFPGR